MERDRLSLAIESARTELVRKVAGRRFNEDEILLLSRRLDRLIAEFLLLSRKIPSGNN